jgi:hypothetical protein
MKKYLTLLFLLLATAPVFAADSAVTGLTETTTPATTDLLYVVIDPAGSPLSRKSTIGNVHAANDARTKTLTNTTIDAEATGNTLTIPFETWYDVAGCNNTSAGHVWNVPTTNAPTATCDTGSNTQKGYLAFNDTTDQSIQGSFVLPTGFTGAIDIMFKWKAAATTGAVGWCMQLIRVADATTSDQAFPAQAAGNCTSDTAKGTTLQENDATITGVTCTNCAASDNVYWRLSRDADGGAVTDSMTGDGLLLKWGKRVRASL